MISRGRRPNTSRVTITAYVESPRKRLHRIPDPNYKVKRSPLSRKPEPNRSHGYDRRAQLLTYARELRDGGGAQHVQWPRWNSKPKSKKKWKWSTAPKKIKASFLGIFRLKARHRMYERIVPEDSYEKKRKDPGSSSSSFCRKLKCLLKELTCGLGCKKDL